MKIKIAKKAGFCMGVRRAVNLVLKALNQYKPPIYTYGPLIHNPQTLELLSNLGVKIIKKIDEDVPPGVCIIRAHGIPPYEKEILAKKHKIVDGTCPRVSKVHVLAKKAVSEGKKVIIIGDKKHSEVKGILGYCKDSGFVVSSKEDIKNLPIEAFKSASKGYIILSQTTQDRKKIEEISQEILREIPGGKIINTICNATKVRQDEVKRLCKECSCIIVIGGRFSANTKRLAQIAQDEGREVYLIEKPEELPLEAIKRHSCVGVTAGASTPNWLINEVINKIKENINFFYKILKYFVILSLNYILAFILFLTGIFNFLNFSFSNVLPLLAFSFFFMFFRTNFYSYLKRKDFIYFYPSKYEFFKKKSFITKVFLSISLFISTLLSILYKPFLLILMLIFILLDLLFLKTSIYFLLDLFFLISIIYIVSYFNFITFLICLEAILMLIFIKFYLEEVYLQTDGFLPTNFWVISLNLDEKKIFKLFWIINFLSLFLLIFLLVYNWLYLILGLVFVLNTFLIYLLKKRPLGQIIYMEELILLPSFSFYFLSLVFKYF